MQKAEYIASVKYFIIFYIALNELASNSILSKPMIYTYFCFFFKFYKLKNYKSV